MKKKVQFQPSRAVRRALSVSLALAMAVGLLPAGALTARAAGSAEYVRPSYPETAILNYYTGSSAAFLEGMKGETDGKEEARAKYWQYNAAPLFGIQYKDSVKPDKGGTSLTKEWSGFADSALRELSRTSGDLEVSFAGTFYNKLHTHSHFRLADLNEYETTITTYEKAIMRIGGTRLGGSGSQDLDFTNLRVGDGEYTVLPYGSETASITFTTPMWNYKDWKDRECRCNGASVSSMVISFRDAEGPQLSSVSYSTDGGNTWRDKRRGVSLGGGDTLTIRLSFDEPIRFAEDKVPDQDLYLYLIGDGKSQNEDLKARLTRLEGNSLYFTYTVPSYSQQSVELKIDSLDLSQLTSSTLSVPLKQLYKSADDSFFLEGTLDGVSNGYSTSTSYITDIAGNPMSDQSVPGAGMRIDNQPPYVAGVEFDLSLHNSDVKKALGKENMDPGSAEYETSYRDDSDRYLGVGDGISLYIHLNEKADLTLPETSPGSKLYLLNWKKATATTNIWDSSINDYVTVRSRYFTPTLPWFQAEQTTFLMDYITITDTMRVDGEKIMVTQLTFDDDVTLTDLYGNEAEKTGGQVVLAVPSSANGNPPALDVTPPAVTGSSTDVPTAGGFRYTMEIHDETTQTAGTYGSFTLNQTGDSRAYRYLWAVTASENAPAAEDENAWTVGVTGVGQEFIQHETNYLHVRPYGEETYYNLSGCTLTVEAKDYAGNVSHVRLPSEGALSWYIDNLAPTVTAGGSSRVLNGDTGELTARIDLADSHGISDWQYAWGDSAQEEPTTWQGGTLTDTESDSVRVAAEKSIQKGSRFSGYLWVRAWDNSQNKNEAGPVCLGLYSYDLTEALYALDSTTELTPKAALTVTDLGAEDALIFLVPEQTGSGYYALAVRSTDEFADTNIFDMDGWKRYDVSEEDGVYTFTNPGAAYMGSLQSGSFAGELTVTVLSGKAEALTFVGTSAYIESAGNEAQNFCGADLTLRVAGIDPKKNYIDPIMGNSYITLSSKSDLDNENAAGYWDGTDQWGRDNTLLSTLEGVTFDIAVSEDNYGWACSDIDWQASRLVLTNESTGAERRLRIGPFQAKEDGMGQSVTVPAGEYDSGIYNVSLNLMFRSDGSEYDVPLKMANSDGTAWRVINGIVVDATRPNSDFTLASVAYDADSLWYKNAYGVQDIYEERECVADGGLITLPVAGGCFGDGAAASSAIYKLTVRSANEGERGTLSYGGSLRSYTGQYYVQLWNTADPNKKVKLYAQGEDQSAVTNGTKGFTVRASEQDNENYVYLAPDMMNTVAMQKVYSNGSTSDIKYVRVKPVTDQLQGALTIDKAARQLVFTPDNAAASIGAQVYAWVYQNGQDYMAGQGERVQMGLAADGTWRCALAAEGGIYRVLTVNSSGSVWEGGEAAQRAPWFAIAPRYTDSGSGTYTLEFAVRDDLGAMDTDGLTVDLGFNEAYSGDTLRFTLADLTEAAGYSEYNRKYEWMETGVSDTGIYRIEATRSEEADNDYLSVKVYGVVKKLAGDPAEGTQTEQQMDLSVTVTDGFGYTASDSTGSQAVTYCQPLAYQDGADAPALEEDGLALTFTQPVQPTESWAWRESDGGSFAAKWTGAFPILANGDYEIRYRDVFGNVCAQALTVDAFTVNGKDWGVDVAFSETALTREAVEVTGTMRQDMDRAGLLIWDAEESEVLVPEGLYNGKYYRDNPYRDFDSALPWKATSKNATSNPRTVKLEENTTLLISCYNTQYVMDSDRDLMFAQRVHVDNIAKEAPGADVRYYVTSLAREFTRAELEDYIRQRGGSLTVTGNVRVWYKTSRHVTPIEGTGSTYTFTPSGGRDYTFRYQDDMGNTAGADGSLPDGLTLAEPAAQPEDTLPPMVDVDVYVKRFGTYQKAASFTPADETAEEIAERFGELGYAQGYSLAVNAVDPSGVTIAVSEAEGVTLSGNLITVEKSVSFTVTVADCSDNSEKNQVSFTLGAELFAKLDTTAPTAKATSEATSMYGKNIYVKLDDLADNGQATGTAVMASQPGVTKVPEDGTATGKDAAHAGEYKIAVTDNVALQFAFYDYAGNQGEIGFNVTGIDSAPPELTVTWSPGSRVEDEDGVRYYPPDEWSPVNTNVTAIIQSNKAMYDLTLNILGRDVKLLDKGGAVTANPYILEENGVTLARISYAPERVTVIYPENCPYALTFTAGAASGRKSTVALDGFSGIDKGKPDVTQVQEPLCRRDSDGTAYPAPYAVRVTLTPNEQTTSPNYGGTERYTDWDGSIIRVPVTYDDGTPLELTFTENGVYYVRFTDRAGNNTIVPVTIDGIDRTAPALTLSDRTEDGSRVTVKATVDEPCTITWGNGNEYTFTTEREHTISFTDNGAFSVVAVDAAGNETSRTVVVSSIDKLPPSISFDRSTVYLLAGSTAAELTAALDGGYTAWDNVAAEGWPAVSYDAGAVDLTADGLYTVVYTVTDAAGNAATANRLVRVIGAETACVRVDGELILPGSTAVLRAGAHNMTLENCAETYTVKARKGILSEGQMKYLSGSSLSFDAQGGFTVTGTGYYTLLVTTQSRQTVRILLYVEQ